jgi:tetratricopeptide (TPR) repeat protein
MSIAALASVFLLGALRAPQEGPSIEDLHRVSKERAEKSRKTASGPLAQLITILEIPYDQDKARVDATINTILTFKEPAVRALVEGLSAPAGAPRGQNCARALARCKEPSVVGEIENRLANAGSETKKRMAWVLGRHAEPKSVEILTKMFGDADAAVMGEAALSLGRIKAKDAAMAIAEKLDKAPAWLGRNLLTALGDLEDPRTHPHIAAYLDTPAATECVGAAAAALHGVKARELLVPAMKLLLKWKGSPEDNLSMAQAVAQVVTPADRDALNLMKKTLTEVSAQREVQEELAYALHFSKDSTAKNWLLADVNDRIKDNPESEKLLRRRARINLRLKIHRDAVRDYETIKRLSKNKLNNINLDGDYWIESARAYAGTKNYQSAADCLRNAMTLGLRASAFKDYEEFAEMRKQAKFLPLFENND